MCNDLKYRIPIWICIGIAARYMPSVMTETAHFFLVIIPVAIAIEIGRLQGRSER